MKGEGADPLLASPKIFYKEKRVSRRTQALINTKKGEGINHFEEGKTEYLERNRKTKLNANIQGSKEVEEKTS